MFERSPVAPCFSGLSFRLWDATMNHEIFYDADISFYVHIHLVGLVEKDSCTVFIASKREPESCQVVQSKQLRTGLFSIIAT